MVCVYVCECIAEYTTIKYTKQMTDANGIEIRKLNAVIPSTVSVDIALVFNENPTKY